MTDAASAPLILSVDDDPDIRALVAQVLTGAGFDVLSVDSGKACLDVVRTRTPALILLDVMMPDMSGFAVCEELQLDPCLVAVPIVFLTALDGEQDRARAFSLGAVAHLVKPFRPAELVETVKRHLETAARFCEIVEAENQWSEQVVPTDFLHFRDYLKDNVAAPSGSAFDYDSLRPQNLYARCTALGLGQSDLAALIAKFARLKRLESIKPEQIDLAALPSAFCRKNLVVPVRTTSGPGLAVSHPFDLELHDTVHRFWDPGVSFDLFIAEPRVILSLLTGAASGVPEPSSDKDHVYRFGSETDIAPDSEGIEPDFDPDSIVGDGPIAFIANNMISAAAAQRASDIHIEPKESNAVVRFRVDGDLRDFVTLNRRTASMLISRLKALAGLDIAERRKPQDGSLEAVVGEGRYKLRLATTSTPSGESLIVRLLEVTTKPKPLTELGMTDEQAHRLEMLSRRSQGLIVVVGATGSGKTTTIYSIVTGIDGHQRSILSIEDPVEYRIPLANQQQVNDKAGVTFESLLKSVVRQDPDVLFLGEIRDPYSAKMAVDFASTGHLTITSLHTTNATTAIFRMERLGINREDMAEAVLAIVAQRLVKRLCPSCKTIRPITPAERDQLAPFTADIPETVAEAKGCPACDGTGYHGREAVVEVFEFDPAVQQMIRAGQPVARIRETVRQGGGVLLTDRAIQRVRDHVFALRDVYDRVLAEELLSITGEAATAEIDTAANGGGHRSAQNTQAPPANRAGKKAGKEAAKKVAAQDPAEIAAAPQVLVVDDDPDSRALVERALESAGCGVVSAEDGASALVELGGHRFDLMIADLAMPTLDGFTLLQVMASQKIDVPVIFLTGSGLPEDEARGLSLGAVDYIRKPARRDVLLARVARVLGRLPIPAGSETHGGDSS
ncbi:MAG: ATPase, T2SS/T4P/T4SS family [Coriobacteriia bacterium]|nr:ATPase, T2SS/T4P/T4SS family [Coriobacteriia bacterium]